MNKKNRESTSRNSSNSIPEDIIYDIFSWLPVKSLTRFKCLSKFYYSLVSDPSFVDIHHRHSISRPKFLAHSRKNNFYTIDVKVEDGKASTQRIEELVGTNYPSIGYVNGLFCLWNPRVQSPVIYNPTTGKVRSLPCLMLVQDRTPFYYYAIGFEPNNKKYKIFRYTYPLRNYWVITLGTNESWRVIKSASDSLCRVKHGDEGVCIDGAIYLLGAYKHKLCIMSFNVRTENFKIISLWEDLQYIPGDRSFNLIELKGKLAAIDHTEYGRDDLWILERSKCSEEWVKHTAFTRTIFSKCTTTCFISGTPDGEIVLTNARSKPNWIFFYDLKKKSWREIEIVEATEETEILRIYSHVDSLISCTYC